MRECLFIDRKVIRSLDDIPAGHRFVARADVPDIWEIPTHVTLNGITINRVIFVEAIKAIARYNKIAAVKLLRNETGFGLKESKYFIDALFS